MEILITYINAFNQIKIKCFYNFRKVLPGNNLLTQISFIFWQLLIYFPRAE